MQKIKRLLVFLPAIAAVMFSARAAVADTTVRAAEHVHNAAVSANTRFIPIDGGGPMMSADSIRTLISLFYYNQFRHAQDPELPYFMFVSKRANMAMGLGGVVKMRGWFDWGGSIPVNGFSPYLIPIPSDPRQRRRLAATPAGTALYLTILAKKTRIGDIMGYIEGNFNGYSGVGFKLSRAFVTVGDWTVGYTNSTFTDPSASAPMIDGAGPNAETEKTNVLVRYMHTLRRKWVLAAALEFPTISVRDYADLTASCKPWIPDAVAFGQYQWDGGASHLRLSAMVRSLPYRDLVTGRNRMLAGWGTMLSTVVKAGVPLTFYGQMNIGQGNGSYLQDLQVDNTDLLPREDRPGRLYAPFAMGASVGVRYYILPELFVSAEASQMSYFTRDGAPSDMYRRGFMASTNVFWYITSRISTGVEYLYGHRQNAGGDAHGSNRVTAFFQFSF